CVNPSHAASDAWSDTSARRTMLSLGCRSIPSRVISQIHVDELLLECLNINLTRRALELFPWRKWFTSPTGQKAQICDSGHTPTRNRSLVTQSSLCVI